MGMLKTICLAAGIALAIAACDTGSGAGLQENAGPAAPAQGPAVVWSFEDVEPGLLPDGWKVEATHQHGPLATWEVVEDESAPSGSHLLALTRTNHASGGTFNLCWTDQVSFRDGEIQVRFKAVRGRVDQGGGVIWRARDENNYYIARFNPLEDNFRIYFVKDGVRQTLASVDIELEAGRWHTLKIVQRGRDFEGWLDGQKLLAGSDDTFPEAGGVGLWTKADAVTSFDDFTVRR